MKKPDSLRRFLTEALPELARNPEDLSIYVTGGTLAFRMGGNLGFEQRYTLHLLLLNFRGDPGQLFLPLSLWLREHQPDLILNHETGVEAITFNVDIVDAGAVDVEMTFPLTEAVDVKPDGSGGYAQTTRAEPLPPDFAPLTDPVATLRQIYAPGGDASEYLVGYPDSETGA